MKPGFVYILLNPLYPRHLKIGRTGRASHERARDLSRQTGVPEDFIVLYDALVSDSELAESQIHARLASHRAKGNKEFFLVPPKEAILALQEIASRFPSMPDSQTIRADLLPHLAARFSEYMDSKVAAVRVVQARDLCYMELDRRVGRSRKLATSIEDIPLGGLAAPKYPTRSVLDANVALLRACDAYDWINLVNGLFSATATAAIAKEWERPGGPVEQARKPTRERGPDET